MLFKRDSVVDAQGPQAKPFTHSSNSTGSGVEKVGERQVLWFRNSIPYWIIETGRSEETTTSRVSECSVEKRRAEL